MIEKQHFEPIQTDLVVVGGGLTGVFAAIAAKRTSPTMTVWLIEQYGFLGGMATAGYVYPMMGYSTQDPTTKQRKRIIGGLFQEMMNQMHDLGYTEKRAPADCYGKFDPMMMRCVLDKMIEDAGIKLLFHAVVNTVDVEDTDLGKQIKKCVAQTKAGSIDFIPRWVIDTSGDGDVLFHAGAKFVLGREPDHLVQPGTLNFRMGNIKWNAPNSGGIGRAVKKEKATGNPLTPRDDCLAFITPNGNERHFNQTRVANLDFTDPFQMTQAELEGRHQTERFIQFLRNKVRGFRHSSVVSIASQLGLRETRHFMGDYVLTEENITQLVQFPDRICLGNYPIDIHDPKGTASTDMRGIPPGKFYSIPFRSLIPEGFYNVIIAGRPISATHVAHSAFRVMPICSAMGHAAGIAAGIMFEITETNGPISFRDLPIDLIQASIRNQKGILE